MSKTASQFTFSHKELARLMLRDAGITEGYWTLSVAFRLGAGAFGPSPEEVAPTAFVSIEGIGISKLDHPADQPLPPMTFNAAELVSTE